jgi:hypothetical protein
MLTAEPATLSKPPDNPPPVDSDTDKSIAPPIKRVHRYNRWIGLAVQACSYAAFAAIIYAAVVLGLSIRQQAWDNTERIHFGISMSNAIQWGRYTNKIGWENVYEQLYEKYGDTGDYRGPARIALDYPPLRLLIISHWEAWAERKFATYRGPPIEWRRSYAFNEPMLWGNTACELLGAVSMFLLVQYWLSQCARGNRLDLIPRRVLRACPERSRIGYSEDPDWVGRGKKPARRSISAVAARITNAWQIALPYIRRFTPARCAWPALIAALLVWFNPALIFNAHCYEQWDAWLLGPFLLAIYLGLRNGWLTAGLLIGVVSMMKGQILIITPVLMIWQLFALRPQSIIRLAVGILLGIFLCASLWLVPSREAFVWIVDVVIAMALLVPLFFKRDWTWQTLLLSAGLFCVAGAVFIWPWVANSHLHGRFVALGMVLALALTARMLPPRWLATWACAGLAWVLYSCVDLFNGSMAWYTIGIEFPTRHWKTLYWTHATNLGTLLQDRYRWEWADEISYSAYLPHLPIMPLSWWTGAGYVVAVMAVVLAVAVLVLAWLKIQSKETPIQSGLFRAFHRLQHISGFQAGLLVFLLGAAVYLFTGIPQQKIFDGINQWNALDVMPMRYLMISGYVVALVICAIGITIKVRRRDPRLLFAIVAPWVVMFALLPQMCDRYLLWASVFSAGAAVVGFEGFLLYLLMSAICISNMALEILANANRTPEAQNWLPILQGLFPDIAWAVLLIAGIWLYLAVVPTPARTLNDKR